MGFRSQYIHHPPVVMQSPTGKQGDGGRQPTMRIDSLQLKIKDRPKEQTPQRVLSLLDRTGRSDLVLLPELWPGCFFSFARCEADSEPLDGPTVTALRCKARQLQSPVFMGSLVEREGTRLFNTALLLGPDGELLGRYRKMHL